MIYCPTRGELTTFLKTLKLITAFESLFGGVNDAVQAAQGAQTTANLAAPSSDFTGMLGFFPVLRPNWVLANGGTIGSATSGATNRANADTSNLFAYLWTSYSNAELPIQTSAGAGTARGASAAADFAANKRLPTEDWRGMFPRALDSGRGVDPARTLSNTPQAFATRVGVVQDGGVVGGNVYAPPGAATTLYWDTNGTLGRVGSSGTETRPVNLARLACLHL